MVKLIGGLIFWDPDRPVTTPDRPVTTAQLHAMADRVPGATDARTIIQGSVGLFAASDFQDVCETEQVIVAVDADPTNLRELQAITGRDGEGADLFRALYELEGPGFLRRVRGAFVVAIWDRRQRSLLLAVDRFGIKRLHYATDSRSTAFASRPSALLATPGVEARVHRCSIT